MCISPEQMSNQELEQNIAGLQDYIDKNKYPQHHDYYRNRIKLYEELLKERAESGEYVNN